MAVIPAFKEKTNIMKTILNSKKAPAAIGPYSQGVVASRETIYVSGQLPIDPATGEFAGDTIESQTEMSLENVQNILKEAGVGMEHVVQATVYLSDIGDFAAMNGVYARYFKENCPAEPPFR